MLSELRRPLRWIQIFVLFSLAYYLLHQYRDPQTWRERGVPFQPSTFKVGDVLPDFVLSTCEGGDRRLKDLGGALRLVVFWASWCHSCVQEFSEFEHLLRKFPQITLVPIQVDGQPGKSQGPPSLHAFGVTYFCDPKGLLAEAFDISALPHAFVIGPRGQVLHVQLGDGAWTSKPMLERLASWIQIEKSKQIKEKI